MTLETAGAVILVVTAISGIVFTIYKLRPESTKIFVDSARVSVEMADASRDEIRAELAAEKAEHTEYRKSAGAHMSEQATIIRGLRTELKHCKEELERLRGQGGGPS